MSGREFLFNAVPLIREHFDAVYRADYTYRLTGIVLSDLRGEGNVQLDLFGEAARAERVRKVYEAIDQLDAKYGKHTVFLGSSFAAMQGSQHAGERAEQPRRRQMLLKGEGERKRLGIPLLGEVRSCTRQPLQGKLPLTSELSMALSAVRGRCKVSRHISPPLQPRSKKAAIGQPLYFVRSSCPLYCVYL